MLNNYPTTFAILPLVMQIIVVSAKYTPAIVNKFGEDRGYEFLHLLLRNCRHNSLYVNIVLNIILDLIPIGPDYQKCSIDDIRMARNFDAFDALLQCFVPYLGSLPPKVAGSMSPLQNPKKVIKEAKATENFLSELLHGIMGLFASHPENFQILV